MYDIMMFEWQEHVVNMMGMSLRYEGNAMGNNPEIMVGLSGTKLQDQNPWNIFRQSINTIQLDGNKCWFTIKLGNIVFSTIWETTAIVPLRYFLGNDVGCRCK